MISIIGAGPAGNYAASLLAKHDSVHVYEDHNRIGRPIQCTGLLTSNIEDIVPIKQEFLVNKIGNARIFAPNKEYIDLKLRKKNYVVDRELFDGYFASLAESNGAVYHLNHRFTGCSINQSIKLKFSNGNTAETDILIGADGPRSEVAKSAGIFGSRRFMIGAQARVRLNEKIDPDLIEFHLPEQGFGWLVPEDDKIARIGVGVYTNTKKYFDEILGRYKYKILEWQSGVIPLYDRGIKVEKENIFLLGDAAAQVKATTAGGLVPAFAAAKELSIAIKNNESYSKRLKKLNLELWLSLLMRKAMDRFSQHDYDSLIKLCSQTRIKKIIENTDRDYPSRFIFKTLLLEPRLLRFGLKLIPDLIPQNRAYSPQSVQP
jgi:digeranylgeranylglycerophospholipid reductase